MSDECKHDWEIFPDEDYDDCEGCHLCHDIPERAHKWWRQCKLCGYLESITVGPDGFERKEEKWGIPI